MNRVSLTRTSGFLTLSLALLAGCDNPTATPDPLAPEAAFNRAGFDMPGAHRQYGTPLKLGRGMARAYVVLDAFSGQTPLEFGVALDARALEGLSGEPEAMLRLPLPEKSPAPYRFVMVDWNPHGHEPPGVYDVPHLDFHFYTVPEGAVDAIVPTNPDFASEADDLPTGDYVPAYYTVLAPPGLTPADVAVPQMGVHWVDTRAPELQGMFGHPEDYRPFDATFIYGSWDGRFTFLEPMVTLDLLRSHPDQTRPVSQPAMYPGPGWFPSAYRITYDARAHEYRVALTQLEWYD